MNTDDLYNYQSVLCDLIITQFDKNIKHDYPIPDGYHIRKIVLESLKQWETKSKIKDDIHDIVIDERDQYSILHDYLGNNVETFGHEWFYGVGDLMRYRQDERGKAIFSYYSHPKLADCEESNDCVKRSLKKEVEEFVKILRKNIEDFYKKFEKEK